MRALLDVADATATGPYGAGVDEDALTVRDLALWLHISEWKARELGKDPAFPSFRLGNQHRFWPSEVREYVSRPRDPWKQSPQSLGRKRKRDGGAPSQLRRTRS